MGRRDGGAGVSEAWRRATVDAPGRGRRPGPPGPAHRPGHIDRIGQVAGVLAARAVGGPDRRGSGHDRPRKHRVGARPPHDDLPQPDQGAGRRPAQRARTCPDRCGHPGRPHRHLRRRHVARGALLGAGPCRRRPDQPRLPALRPAAESSPVVTAAERAAVRRRRRGARLPRSLRRARLLGAAPARAPRGTVRGRVAHVRRRVGDDGGARGQRGPAHRRSARRRHRRHRGRLTVRAPHRGALAATGDRELAPAGW